MAETQNFSKAETHKFNDLREELATKTSAARQKAITAELRSLYAKTVSCFKVEILYKDLKKCSLNKVYSYDI